MRMYEVCDEERKQEGQKERIETEETAAPSPAYLDNFQQQTENTITSEEQTNPSIPKIEASPPDMKQFCLKCKNAKKLVTEIHHMI